MDLTVTVEPAGADRGLDGPTELEGRPWPPAPSTSPGSSGCVGRCRAGSRCPGSPPYPVAERQVEVSLADLDSSGCRRRRRRRSPATTTTPPRRGSRRGWGTTARGPTSRWCRPTRGGRSTSRCWSHGSARRSASVALAVEHVGSTSVPGLAAKPVIDVDLVVADSADEDAWLPPLEAAGFRLVIREPWWHEHRALSGTTRAATCTCSRPARPRWCGTGSSATGCASTRTTWRCTGGQARRRRGVDRGGGARDGLQRPQGAGDPGDLRPGLPEPGVAEGCWRFPRLRTQSASSHTAHRV